MATNKETESQYGVGKSPYVLTICDHILDSQYGQIGLTEVERKIERLPIFKRLHNVSQLGLVNWIFPCALHTRYTHSLGVMHVAGQMALNINSNMGYQFFDESDIQIIRLAGMLHDIGHYPMSHNVEQAYKDMSANKKLEDDEVIRHLKQYCNCPDYLNPKADMIARDTVQEKDGEKRKKSSKEDDFIKSHDGSKGFHHERIGYHLIINNSDIKKFIKEYFVLNYDTHTGKQVVNPKFVPSECSDKFYSETEVNNIVSVLMQAIGNMVVGNYGFEYGQHYHWIEKYSAMIQLIHSDMDADNLDYLLRDASFSGTSYGIMDMGQLMNCLTVAKFKSSQGENFKYLVGIKPKGVGCVDQFLMNKYLAYSQMTLSKYVSILEAMLLRLATLWLSVDTNYRCPELEEMVKRTNTSENFLAFTDSYIIRKIYELDSQKTLFGPLLENIVSRLKNYCAFDIASRNESEVVCTGFSDEEIFEEISKSNVYKRFSEICEQIGDKTGRDIRNTQAESGLFAYRFEQYSLTKQVPISEFQTMFDFNGMDDDRRFNFHYYRLANGIPVLTQNEVYEYAENDKLVIPSSIPQLVVDCTQASLRKLYSMRFVALREYKVEKYCVSS